jgi:uncharacterized protein YvpB
LSLYNVGCLFFRPKLLYRIGEFEILLIIAALAIVALVAVDIFVVIKFLYRKIRKIEQKRKAPKPFPNLYKILFPFLRGRGEAIRNILNKIKGFRILGLNILLVSVFLLSLHFMFFPSPYVIYTYPAQDQAWSNYDRPIEIEFSRPIREGVLELYLSKASEGEWKYVKSISGLPFSRVVQFYPEESFFPGESLVVYVVNFDQRVIGEYPLNFTSANLPDIASVSPSDQEVDVMSGRQIEINLDNPDGDFVKWEVKVTPTMEFELVQESSQKLILKTTEPLKQTQKYKVEIFRRAQTYDLETGEVMQKEDLIKVHESTFRTIKAPLIESFSPEGTGVLPEAIIEVVFDEPMIQSEVETAFSIDPDVEGQITWKDDRTFVFTPNEVLPKETLYKVTFAKGIHSVSGANVAEDIVFEFETVGTVKVIGYNPPNGYVGANENTNISVVFDQEVDHASAQSKFSISPAINGTFSWNGNTLIFDPASVLSASTTYTITVASGVKTIHGFDSKQAFTGQFTTRALEVLLNIAHTYQSNTFGCNADATAMVMTYKGVPTSEAQVLAGVGTQANRPVGNPHVGWVPNYGVYWGPISAYVSSRGLTANVYQNWNLTSALREVEAGNPVVVWYQNGTSAPTNISYTAGDGTYVTAVNGMHSVVIVGYRGTPEAPTLIFYHDPWYGAYRSTTPANFDFRWATWRMGGVPASYTRVGMVVR